MTGTVSVDITIPAGTLLGDAVVFEEFVMIGEGGRQVVVGEHKDLKDAAQTVSLYTDKTTSRRTTSPARTGDDSNSMMWIIIGAVALGAIIVCVIIMNKRRKDRKQ